MIKLAIFDLDGTLLNTIDDLAQSCNYALQSFSYPTHNVSCYNHFVGDGIYKLVERAVPEGKKDKESVTKVLAVFNEYYSSHMMDLTKPYEGIENLLLDLKKSNVLLAVVSNKKHEYTDEIINKYFKGIFNVVIGHREGYNAKPDPVSLLEIVGNLNISKEETMYVGDSNVDILTGKNANIKAIGVTWGFRGREELEEAGAEYIAEDINELRNILFS